MSETRGRAGGFFAVLEGIDGAGKTEQCARIAAELRRRGERVVQTREPTQGEWGLRYRAFARGELEATPEEVLRFFVEDRREHLARVVEPALREGAIVLCDRYEASTRAYQAADGVDPALLERVLGEARARVPDLVLWLRLPPAQALARLQRGALERYERLDFLERVDAGYARQGLEVIDASLAPDAVYAAVLARLDAARAGARRMPERWIRIRIGAQRLEVIDGGQVTRSFPVSTAARGVGERSGSEQTPLGAHEVADLIGSGAPLGAVFVARCATGEICTPELRAAHPGRDWILSRVIRLSGLEEGRNRGGDVDSYERFIYIHGTAEEERIGEPRSHGCIRMRNADVVELFDLLAAGTRVQIEG
jgi:L,D-transpeptidase YbiS